MLKEKSDEELMLAYQLGDEQAFQELYMRHSGRVFAFIRSKIRDDTKARDVFQSSFLKFHRSRSQYKAAFPVLPWIFVICRSEILDSVKKDQRSLEDPTSDMSGFSETSQGVALNLNLETLSPLQVQAIAMRFKEDSSFDEIARTLETSPANARQIVSRAIRTLRSLYGKK